MEWGVVQYPGLIQPVGDPAVWVEPIFFGAWQNQSLSLQPIHEEQNLSGRTGNMPYLALALFANAHFGPDAAGDFADPGAFDITEKSGEFEIRKPL